MPPRNSSLSTRLLHHLLLVYLALPAGAGDGVRGLLEADDTTPAADTSETGTTTTTGTALTAVEQSPSEQVARKSIQPVQAPAAPRAAVLSSRPAQSTRYGTTA